VTGGNDGVIRFWDPFITERAAAILRGHSSSVTHLVVDNREAHVISIDKGKSQLFIDTPVNEGTTVTPSRYHHLGYSNLENDSAHTTHHS
jgi:hypothetical protein